MNKEIAKHVDVMIGNEEDFTACLGFQVEGADETPRHIDVTAFKKMIEKAVKTFPELQSHRDDAARREDRRRAMTGARSAGLDGKFYEAPNRTDLGNSRPRRRRRQFRQRT